MLDIIILYFAFSTVIETPAHSGWAETPRTDRTGGDLIQETPTPGASKRRSRWDETPSNQVSGTPGTMTPGAMMNSMTPATPVTPHASATPLLTPGGITPMGPKAMAMATPTPGNSDIFRDGFDIFPLMGEKRSPLHFSWIKNVANMRSLISNPVPIFRYRPLFARCALILPQKCQFQQNQKEFCKTKAKFVISDLESAMEPNFSSIRR